MEATTTALNARSGPGTIAALFLDLDDFKTINDTLGHAAGDDALIAVAERIRSGLRATDLAARLGGDEFGVLLRDVDDERRAIEVAERMLASLTTPLRIDDTSVDVAASIGIALDSAEVQSVDDLLGNADIAMYRAKALGKRRLHVFRATDPQEQAAREELLKDRGLTVRRAQPTRADSIRLGDVRLEPNAG
jgi:diguanylate cyclase (GGDEF)-like protein